MEDKIFWGNLLGILKTGKWSLTLEESAALVQIYQETLKRSKPEQVSVEIKEATKKKGKL
jgi:hypothetical protein